MTTQSINVINPQLKTQNFKQTPIEEPTIQKEESNSKTPWILGGLSALAALGIYYVVKGRKSVGTKEIKNTVNELKEITSEAFKKDGNSIKKGKAKLANGDNFNGVIKKTTSDGSVLSLEFKNGLLQKSNKIKDGKKVFEKTYTHDSNGNLKTVLNNEKKTLSINIENGEKTVKTTTGNAVKFNIEKKKILSEEKSGVRKDYYYRNNDKNTLKYIKEGEKITKYDKDGKTVVYTVTKDDANGTFGLFKDLAKKFDFGEIKNLKSYLLDKYGRISGKITEGTPIERPKIKTPEQKDILEATEEFFKKIKYKKAFLETKENHFIY